MTWIKNRPLVLSIFGIAYLFWLILVGFSPWLLVPLIVFELILRLFLRLVYGKHYRFALYNYFIIDHPIYGNTFRPGIASQKIDFPVFDKFVFRSGSKTERVNFSINSLGFRGPEFSPTKKPGTIRIFCSGGSTTAGNSVDDDETWPAVLEIELRQRGYRVEVINAGVQGWSSYQELLRFEREIVNYQPDVLLLHQGWNEEFAYSSQNLGRWWQPRVVRNMIETRYLYSGRHPWLSQTRFLLGFYLTQLYFKDFIFNRRMRFTNPKRWACLRQEKYLVAWFDNLREIAREARAGGILVYTINYPGLSDFNDSLIEREIYLKNTRLTPRYADYQAVSKKQIQHLLFQTSPLIPLIDTEKELARTRGSERLEFFLDEIHLSTKGNRWLGQTIAAQLATDKNFNQLKSNLVFDEKRADSIRKEVGKNYVYLDDFLATIIEKLKRENRPGEKFDLPTERYTTF